MTRRLVPLKYIAGINERSLREATDPDYSFRYVDIGTVGRGELVAEPQEMRFEDAPSRARRLVRPGDTIVSTVRTYLRAVWPVPDAAEDLVVSTGFAVLTPRRVNARYFSWWVRSDAFIEEVVARSVGVSYPAINALELGELKVRLPDAGEQRAIAGFLDTETAGIDALIAKKRRMIDVLDLRATATADRLALGLECSEGDVVEARSTYFTVVPRHWDQTCVRHLHCEVQTGPFGSQLHAEEYVEDGWPVVNPANLKHGTIVPAPGMSVSGEKRTELQRHILREGDIVFGRRGEMGRAGLVEAHHVGWLCGTGSLRLRLSPRSPLEPAYLKLLLETTALRHYFELTSIGSTMDNLNSEIVLGMPCLVPPEGEQCRIVTAVRELRSSADSLTVRLDRQISLLQEHRQALITAAVTGELEVPGVAA